MRSGRAPMAGSRETGSWGNGAGRRQTGSDGEPAG